MKRNLSSHWCKRLLTALVLATVVVWGRIPAKAASQQRHFNEVSSQQRQFSQVASDQRHFNEVKYNISATLQANFPSLGPNFRVIGEATKQYNCISYSLGIYDRWTNPETGPADDPLCYMDRLYATVGYQRTPGFDCHVEPGVEKVVVYATLNLDGTIHAVTHAARQESDGTYTSKLGQMPVIQHETPEALRGPSYGLPVAVYARPAHANH